MSLLYADLKRTFKLAIHMRKAKKIRVFSEILLTFFSFYCCENYKTHKCREILHFQKHSRLHNQFWKAAMFFIFVFFHFPCKVIILTSLLSVNKYRILNIFKCKCLVYVRFTCSFVLSECKFCNEIFTMIYLNDFFHVFSYFHSHKIFYFDPC